MRRPTGATRRSRSSRAARQRGDHLARGDLDHAQDAVGRAPAPRGDRRAPSGEPPPTAPDVERWRSGCRSPGHVRRPPAEKMKASGSGCARERRARRTMRAGVTHAPRARDSASGGGQTVRGVALLPGGRAAPADAPGSPPPAGAPPCASSLPRSNRRPAASTPASSEPPARAHMRTHRGPAASAPLADRPGPAHAPGMLGTRPIVTRPRPPRQAHPRRRLALYCDADDGGDVRTAAEIRGARRVHGRRSTSAPASKACGSRAIAAPRTRRPSR